MATPSDYDGKGPPHEAAKGYGKMALFHIHLAMISVGIALKADKHHLPTSPQNTNITFIYCSTKVKYG